VSLIPHYTSRREPDGKYIVSFGNDRYFKISEQTANMMASLACTDSIADAYLVYAAQTNTTLGREAFSERAAAVIAKFNAPARHKYISMRTTLLSAAVVGKLAVLLRPLFLPRCTLPLLAGLVLAVWWRGGLSFEGAPGAKFSVPLFLLLLFLDVLAHELGHLTACRHFGGKHGELGFGFYLMIPVAYADVTGVWMLDKVQRVIVNLSGIYFELVYVAILLIFQREIGPVAIGVVALISGRLVYTLIPFLRSDGYWVLCDLIGVHDLLPRAQKAMREVGRAIWQLRSPVDVLTQPSAMTLASYGLVNAAFFPVFFFGVLGGYCQLVLDFPSLLIGAIRDFWAYGDTELAWSPGIFLVMMFYVTVFRICLLQAAAYLKRL
jgi:putative peptide zinc metalloprotease protein